MSGRLTLSWANKDKALVSDDDGGYDWVDADDPRAVEVRVLDELGVYPPDAEAADNLLIRGDSVDALRALVRIPEYAQQYRGKVKLVYIDPPFNTGQAFEHYDDSLEHSVWLGMMRERLVLIRELLAPDGSVWVHLDDAEMAYCKVLMDEVFGRANFIATFVWQKMDSPSSNNVAIAAYQDYILGYAADKAVFRAAPMEDAGILDAYPGVTDEGIRYRDRLLRKNGKSSLRSERPSMWFPIPGPDGTEVWPIDDDGIERRWGLGQSSVLSLLAADELIWKKRVKPSGDEHWVPYTREYAPATPTRPWPTVWSDVLMNRQAKAQVKAIVPRVATFDTPKPEQLLERIIHIGSNSGDIVLDCFAGSGTTAAVAHKMGRRWVTVELSESTASTFTTPRLQKVIDGDDPGGITKSVGWEGGGAFRELRVAGPTFTTLPEELGGGTAVIDNLPAGRLAHSIAAQLGFTADGHRGRARLTVVDGVVDEVVVDDIVSGLGEGETAVIAATRHTQSANERLTSIRPGSRLVSVPDDLFPRRTAAVTR